MRPFLSILFFIYLSSPFCAWAQQPEKIEAPVKVYVSAEQMPEFAGGQDSLMKYLAANIKYPPEALMNKEQGVSFISFIVDAQGSISETAVLKSSSPVLDVEAMRVIKDMPRWKPGKLNGQPVAVRQTLPIRFRLAEEPKNEIADEEEETVMQIEEQPEYPGGVAAMMKFLATHVKYPKKAQNERIEGLSVISFVVNEQGALSNFKVLKRLGYGTDEEALKALQAMPLWKPGKQNGQPVRVRYTLPVRFSLHPLKQ